MDRKVTLHGLVLVVAFAVTAPTTGLADWPVTYDYDTSDDRAIALKTVTSGDVYVLATGDFAVSPTTVVLKYDSTGDYDASWEYEDAEAIDFEVDIQHGFIFVLASIDDCYYVLQFDTSTSDSLVAVDSLTDVEGELPYSAHITLQRRGDSVVGFLAASTGEYLVGEETEADFLTVCYRADTALCRLWTQSFDWGADPEVCDALADVSMGIATDDSGNVYVVGRSTIGYDTEEDEDKIRISVVAYPPSGDSVDMRNYFRKIGCIHDLLEVRDVAVRDTFVYATCAYYDSLHESLPDPGEGNNFKIRSSRFRVTQGGLGFQSHELYKVPGGEDYHDTPAAMSVGRNGDVFVLGQRMGVVGQAPQGFLAGLSYTEGLRHRRWARTTSIGTVDTVPVDPDEVPGGYAKALALDTLDNVYVVATVPDDSGTILTKRYQSDGLSGETWEYGSSHADTAVDVAVLPSGDVLVLGTSMTADSTLDIVVIKYSPSVDWGWTEVSAVPAMPSGKPVKRGGWLAHTDGDTWIFVAKGYRTTDFYKYDIDGDSFVQLTGMPFETHPLWYKKAPRKGSKGVFGDDDWIYVTQGNNSLGWWRYHTPTDSWERLTDVPIGLNRKKVKGGTDLAYLVVNDTGWVYCLKGYKTEFYRYNVVTGSWETLTEAPIGARPKWDKGSWLCVEDENADVIYAHKAKYHEMYLYSPAGDSWSNDIGGMPFIGAMGRRKKSKDGGSAVWYDDAIYALKGGNTGEFWKYDVPTDSWTELDTMPSNGSTGRKKRVKYGADVVHYGYGVFYALKGNKTVEFWRYGLATPADGAGRSGVMAGLTGIGRLGVTVAPNPLAGGFATLRYSLPKAGPATINVVDVVGRVVTKRTVLATRTGAVSLDLRNLSAGVYLVRLETDDYRTTQKLVVQR